MLLDRVALRLIPILIAVLSHGPALADQAVQHTDVVCSKTSEVAVVRFGMGRNNDPPRYATLPAALDGGLSSAPPSRARTCRLPSGREIAVRISEDAAMDHGVGGGDPAGYFDLQIGGKPVLTKQQWKPRGWTASTWISGVIVNGGRPFLCLRPSEDAATTCEALPATNEIDDRRDAELVALFQTFCGAGSSPAAQAEKAAARNALSESAPPPGLDRIAVASRMKQWTISTHFGPARLSTAVIDRRLYHGESCEVEVPLGMGAHLIDLLSTPDAYGQPESRGGHADPQLEQIYWTPKSVDPSNREEIRLSRTSINGAGATDIRRLVVTPSPPPPAKEGSDPRH